MIWHFEGRKDNKPVAGRHLQKRRLFWPVPRNFAARLLKRWPECDEVRFYEDGHEREPYTECREP